MHSIIIFASGGGSNAAAIIDYFKGNGKASVSLIVCNKPGAGVLNIAVREGIPFLLIDRDAFNGSALIEQLKSHSPSLIVLAGFLWKIPAPLVSAFPAQIINIHPALLPAYGGKGMHGANVHQAVIDNKESESGITIHYVNEVYDSGNIIVQAHCSVRAGDTPVSLASRVLKLEHFYFPRTIEFLLAEMDR